MVGMADGKMSGIPKASAICHPTHLPSMDDYEERLAEVIGRLSAIQDCGADSLDLVEMIDDLCEEFGDGIVHQAIRLLEARRKADGPRASSTASDPLWDRDLDG